MAFGDASKKMADKSAKREANADGTVQEVFVPYHMPTGSGIRHFRYLPQVDENGVAVLTPRLSPNGNQLTEGNKKNGKPLFGLVPDSEFAFVYAWWKVMVDGQEKPRKFYFNLAARWNNPLLKHILDTYGKDSKEAKSTFKTAFAVNVLDLSPVVKTAKGDLFYQSELKKFNLLAYGDKGRLVDSKAKDFDKDKLPTAEEIETAAPLNEIRILEGSYGKKGGRHLFQDFFTLEDLVEDATTGLTLRLPEFKMLLKCTGTTFEDTVRGITQTNDFKPLSPEVIAAPRYDVARMFAAWPDAAVQDLIDLRDWSEVVEDYGLSNKAIMIEYAKQEELFDD